MLKVCCGARGLSHRAGNPCRAALEVPLGEAWQEERVEWQRSSHGKGREITSSTGRTSNPQWENMCFSSPIIGNQEDLHSDGGPKMHHRKAPSTRRASTGCRTYDALGPSRQAGCSHRYGEGRALREATPGKVQQGLRELPNATIRKGPTVVLQLSGVLPHGQDMLEGNPNMQVLCWKPPIHPMQRGQPGHPQVCQLRRGTRNHQQGVSQKANLGQQIQGSTEKSRAATDTGSPNQECLDQKVCVHNGRLPTNFNYSRAPLTLKHTVEVTRPQVARPKPVATKTIVADQRRQTPTVSHPVQRKEDSQRCGVALKSQQSNLQKEDIEAITIALDGATALLRRVSTGKKTPYPGTTKDDRDRSRCDQYPRRIESCFKKGHFQDHVCSHTVGLGNGPFQDYCCSPPVCFDNGPFQDHGCSRPVCFDNGPFQDNGCSPHPVCSNNGPFQDNGGVHSVCSDNGPFQDHGRVHPVCSVNGPFQDHGCVHPVCSDNGPFQDHGCEHSACSDNGPFQDNEPPYVPITVLFRTTVVHAPYVPIAVLFRTMAVYIRYVLITVLFRTTVVHSPDVPITVLLRTTVVYLRYVLTVLFRTTVVYFRYVLVTVLFRTTVVHNPYALITALFRDTMLNLSLIQ